MPLYEYKCTKCGHRFEKIQSVSAHVSRKCPKCNAKAERQSSAPAIQFKGTGWYVTDYGGKQSATGSSEASGDGASSKAEGKPAESKPPESKPAAEKSASKKDKK